MAEQSRRSQAERAVEAKSKYSKSKKGKKSPKVSANNKAEKKSEIPVRLISSVICIGLFVLFLIIAFVPEGIIVDLLGSLIHGLIGKAAFIVAIPVLLYLFIIHAFSGKRPVMMRTICLVFFTAFCGSIAHLSLNGGSLPGGFAPEIPPIYSSETNANPPGRLPPFKLR